MGKVFHALNCAGALQCNATDTLCQGAPHGGQCLSAQGYTQPANADYPKSWTEPPVDYNRVRCPAGTPSGGSPQSSWWCESPAPEEDYADYNIASASIARLRAHVAAGGGSPLFLAVGFRDDHIPWASPKRFRDLYDLDSVPITKHPQSPDFDSVPRQAWQWPVYIGGLGFNITDKRWLPDADLRDAMLSYLANIAFTDAQLGRVLSAFDEVGYTSKTLTVYFGE